jgi:short chain dehydrogenase/Protein of unknown function (DUF3489)
MIKNANSNRISIAVKTDQPQSRAMPPTKTTKAPKSQIVAKLLSHVEGASLDDLCKVPGWQQHSARSVMAAARAAANATATAIDDMGGRAVGHVCDVLSQNSINAAANFACDTAAPLDFIINNVVAMLNGHPKDIPLSEWQRMMDLNYFSAIRTLEVFMP